MSKITDYAFLKKTFGTSGVNVIGSFQLSQSVSYTHLDLLRCSNKPFFLLLW